MLCTMPCPPAQEGTVAQAAAVQETRRRAEILGAAGAGPETQAERDAEAARAQRSGHSLVFEDNGRKTHQRLANSNRFPPFPGRGVSSPDRAVQRRERLEFSAIAGNQGNPRVISGLTGRAWHNMRECRTGLSYRHLAYDPGESHTLPLRSS